MIADGTIGDVKATSEREQGMTRKGELKNARDS
jgi:hypothetical protein